MPAASPDIVENSQPSGTAKLMVTIFSYSNECYGGAHTGIDMDYNTDYVVSGIVSYYVSRNLTANEQMDFSTYGPPATLASGYSIAPACSKFSKTVSPGYKGEPLTSGSGSQPQCYAANGESVSLRVWKHLAKSLLTLVCSASDSSTIDEWLVGGPVGFMFAFGWFCVVLH